MDEMSEPQIRISYTIEPSWTIDHYTGELQILQREVDGMDEIERLEYIEQAVDDAVQNDCSYGWHEITDNDQESEPE